MSLVAVTGASGKTGWRVVDEALKRGLAVRAIVRPGSVLPAALAEAEQQAGEPHAAPEMGLPEGWIEGVVAEPPDFRLHAQADHPDPAEQGKAGPVAGLPNPPKSY